MKTKIFFLTILSLSLFSCTSERQKENPIDSNQIWLSSKMIDKAPEIAEGSSDSLLNTVANYMSKEKINQLRAEYNVLVNKRGKIEGITISESNNQKVDSIVIAIAGDWKFNAGSKSGKNVNSIYPIKLHLGVSGSLKPINESEYKIATDVMPEIIGGIYSIQKNIRYPEIAKRAGIEGKVFVRAFIDEEGNITNAQVIKGIGAGCDEAALDAVKSVKFNPGKENGKPVKVQVTIPIQFKLQ